MSFQSMMQTTLQTIKERRKTISKKTQETKRDEKVVVASSLEERIPESASDTYATMQPLDSRRFWITGLTIVGIGLFLRNASQMVYLIITAFIVSMAVENLILYFQKWMKRGVAIGIAYVLLIIFVLSWVTLVIPLVVGQIAWLVEWLIQQISTFQALIQQEWLSSVIATWQLPESFKTQLIEYLTQQDLDLALQKNLTENLSQLVSVWTTSIGDASTFVVRVLGWFFSALIQASIVVVMAVFFSLEKRVVIISVSSFARNSEKLERVLHRLYHRLGAWLKGQLILCISIGVMAWVGLLLLDWVFGIALPNKLSLALIAWLTEFIPYLWPLLWMIPALLIGVTEFGGWWFVAVLTLYILIQQLEWNVLVPLVMYHTLWVSPLLIFICMIIWWSLFWFLWVLLAVPLAVIIKILYASYSTHAVDPAIP